LDRRLGCVAATDPTVSRLKASIAFDSELVQDTAKMSDLFSFAAAILVLAMGRLRRMRKQEG
jgi:NhaA family Na+:H+ antiporter